MNARLLLCATVVSALVVATGEAAFQEAAFDLLEGRGSFERAVPGQPPPLFWNRMGSLPGPTDWCTAEGATPDGQRFVQCQTHQELSFGWESPSGPLAASLLLRASRPDTPCTLRLSYYDRHRRVDAVKEVRVGTEWAEHRIETDVVFGGPVEFGVRTTATGVTLEADRLRLLRSQPPPNAMQDQKRATPLRVDLSALQRDPGRKGERSGSIPLTLSWPEGRRPALPVARGGIPLPRGLLFSRSQVRLLNASGKEVPLQADVLARWNADRSVKALLLTFLFDESLGNPQHFRLEYGPSVTAGAPVNLRVSVRQSGGRVVLDSGMAQVVLDGRGIAEATVAGRKVLSAGRGSFFVNGAGQVFLPAQGRVDREWNGPLAATAVVRGEHQSEQGDRLGRFTLRVTLFAGCPTLLVSHTLLQDGPDLVSDVRAAGLELGLASPARVGPQEQLVLEPAVAGTPEISSLAFGPEVPRVRIRDARQNYPKGIRIEGNRLTIWAWPDLSGRGVCWSQGLSRTTEFLLDLDPSVPDVPFATTAEPLLTAPATWYCDSGVFGFLQPPDPVRFPLFEKIVGNLPTLGGFAARTKEQATFQGMFNYGDATGDGGWANLETMADHELFLHFFRTLNREHFDMARLAAEHYRDVDIHHGLGFCHVHCQNHTASAESWSHSWIQGLRDLYFLKGDGACLDSMLTVGARAVAKKYGDTTGRDFSLLINNLVDLYGATGLPELLRAAQGQIEVLAARQDPTAAIPGAEKNSWYEDRYAAGCAFTWYGCLALAKLHQDTNDPHIAEILLRELDLSLDVATKSRRSGVALPTEVISEDKRAEVLGVFALGRGCVLFPPLGYAYRLTRDPKYLRLGMDVVAYCLLNQRGGSDASATSFITAFLREASEAGWGAKEEAEAYARARDFSWSQWPKELTNGGFEEIEFRGWEGVRRTPGATEFEDRLVRITYRQDDRVARSGRRSLCIHSENPRRTVAVQASIALDPASEYHAEVWIKKGGTQSAAASVAVREYDTGYRAAFALSPEGEPVEGWQKVATTFLSRNRSVASLQLVAQNGLGDVWFDDAAIRKVGPTYHLLTGNGGPDGPYAGLVATVEGHYEPSEPMRGERAGDPNRVPFSEGCLTDGSTDYSHLRQPNPSYAYWERRPQAEILFRFGQRVRVRRVRIHLMVKGPHGTANVRLFDPAGREVACLEKPVDGWNTLAGLDLVGDRLMLRFQKAPEASYITLSEVEVWGEERVR